MNSSDLHISRIASVAELAPLAPTWDGLAGERPFLRWDWLEAWWRHYGVRQGSRATDRELCVLVARDREQRVVGIAPWFLGATARDGRALQFLGSGEVCSDYLSVLCQPERQGEFAAALAGWLCGGSPERPRWDALILDGVAQGDPAVDALRRACEARGCQTAVQPALHCWRLELPAEWSDYEARLSKSHRKQLRRLTKRWRNDATLSFRRVEHVDELPRAMAILEHLHQRRRQTKGEAGCFASTQFAGFHRDAALRMLRDGRLWMQWIEIAGKPVAIDYALASGGVVYCYQSGIDPQSMDEEPGRLSFVALLERAHAEGYRAVDLLRGDEPYKAHFRAEPVPCELTRIAANTAAARLRHGVWQAGRAIKQLWTSNSPAPTTSSEPEARHHESAPAPLDVALPSHDSHSTCA